MKKSEGGKVVTRRSRVEHSQDRAGRCSPTCCIALIGTLSRPCAHIAVPPHSLHRRFSRRCAHIPAPPHFLHQLLCRPCGHIPACGNTYIKSCTSPKLQRGQSAYLSSGHHFIWGIRRLCGNSSGAKLAWRAGVCASCSTAGRSEKSSSRTRAFGSRSHVHENIYK